MITRITITSPKTVTTHDGTWLAVGDGQPLYGDHVQILIDEGLERFAEALAEAIARPGEAISLEVPDAH